MEILKSLGVFILAGLCEISGGYLIWLWLKNDKPYWYGISGALILILYGMVATLQQANFARTYATYGGIFIIMSIWWAWQFDNFKPDKYDLIGALIAIVGVSVIIYYPRR